MQVQAGAGRVLIAAQSTETAHNQHISSDSQPQAALHKASSRRPPSLHALWSNEQTAAQVTQPSLPPEQSVHNQQQANQQLMPQRQPKASAKQSSVAAVQTASPAAHRQPLLGPAAAAAAAAARLRSVIPHDSSSPHGSAAASRAAPPPPVRPPAAMAQHALSMQAMQHGSAAGAAVKPPPPAPPLPGKAQSSASCKPIPRPGGQAGPPPVPPPPPPKVACVLRVAMLLSMLHLCSSSFKLHGLAQADLSCFYSHVQHGPILQNL